jgi:hypothetical protein
MYVIWSFEHGGWWAPHRCGYVLTLPEAGRYTAEEALAILFDANIVERNETALPENEAADDKYPATTGTGFIA